jgi:hypothetical protein
VNSSRRQGDAVAAAYLARMPAHNDTSIAQTARPRQRTRNGPMTDQEITDCISGLLLELGVEMACIHAWEICGFLVTEQNADDASDGQLIAWFAALAEGEELFGPLSGW